MKKVSLTTGFAPLLLVLLLQLVSAQPFLDEIRVVRASDGTTVLDMISRGELQIYFSGIRVSPEIAQKLKTDPNLAYKYAYGLYYELTFNPVGPTFANGELNPFSVPRIREAMNYIVNRSYIVECMFYGFARPKFFPLVSEFPEYQRLKDYLQQLEAQYSYNFTKGAQIIEEEMVKLGAVKQDDKWWYNGSPVVIKFLIRIEDQRKQIGDYVSDQLENLGFTVERMYKNRREASPIWMYGNPADGQWHVYTGGWITTAVSRDDADVWAYFYTPLGSYWPLWQAYKPDPIFYEVARKLWNREFKTIEERQELMAKAANLSLKDSARVWLVDAITPYVYSSSVEAEADLAGGFSTAIVSRTLRYKDKVGGVAKAGISDIFVNPWNPIAVAETIWVVDAVVISSTQGYAFLTNPYTGLPMPERMINVTVFVEKDVSTTVSSDWLTLKFVDRVDVPADAWWGYDTKAKKVVTVGEAGVKAAKVRIVVNYGDVIGKIKYHDGTTMSLADWVALWPFGFYRVDPESPLYDASAVPGFTEWRNLFMGWRILSTSPLVIEWYGNFTHPEAEFIATYFVGWPSIPWHVTTIGIRAEEKGLLAFSADKADKMKVEWMNYIGGPSLKVLSDVLDEMINTGYIPFSEWASQYIKPDEAKARYQALKNWYNAHGHFWVGEGPYYLDRAMLDSGTAVLKGFTPPVYLVALGSDLSIYYRYDGAWKKLPAGFFIGPPAALRVGSLLYFAVKGRDSRVWVGYLNLVSGVFSGWVKLPGSTLSRPALAYNGFKIILVVRGGDSNLYLATLNPDLTGFSGWKRVPGFTFDAPAAAVLNGELHIVVRWKDNSLWHARLDAFKLDTSKLVWSRISGSTDKAPALATGRNELVLAIKGLNGLTYVRTWANGWRDWEEVPQSYTADAPAVVGVNDLALLFMRRVDGTIWSAVRIKPGVYKGLVQIPGSTPAAPSATP
jgi:peptide/nickel transport system substrate-binding protein